MKRIEIDVVDARAEQTALLAWAARVDAGEAQRSASPSLHFASYRQLHATLTERHPATCWKNADWHRRQIQFSPSYFLVVLNTALSMQD